MKPTEKELKRELQLKDINEAMRSDPVAFAASENARYEQAVAAAAESVAVRHRGWTIVMLAGPSSVGKTTTANKLQQQLERRGVPGHVVSLDNFYRGRGIAPRLPNGNFDYESIEALDTELLIACMSDILHTGRTQLPVFDFIAGVRKPDRADFVLPGGAVVIFEGIHALNPLFAEHLGDGHMLRVFVNTLSRFYDGDETMLTRRELRLTRRMLRDDQFRASPADNTLHMWQQVVRGEERYILPFCHDVDIAIDTTIGYEPCVMQQRLLTLLQHTDHEKLEPYTSSLAHLCSGIQRFVPASAELVPPDGLLREFLG